MTEKNMCSIRTGSDWQLNLGANLLQDATVRFRVWAPRVRELSVLLPNRGANPILLAAEGNGYTTRPKTFLTLAPFGVFVYRKE